MTDPNYKNWVPKGLIASISIVTILSLIGLIFFNMTKPISNSAVSLGLTVMLWIIFLVAGGLELWGLQAYIAFSYKGKRKLSKQIIEGIAAHVSAPDKGKILDVGCGSGALTIACAKHNPNSLVIGIDRWGKEYASFSKHLCEENATAEGVKNTAFLPGNAIHLDFPDESFDAVTSNYVYHNISGKDKQELVLETLRVLKKGGSFAIHDLMSSRRYGDMQILVSTLKQQGYSTVHLQDTTDGIFMDKKEARRLKLTGSSLLYGTK
jgi:ubiquinone/menaquinone biosynthesis C-methylase UbiE